MCHYRPVVFSFDSPQEYSADFVMATLATTTSTATSDITTDHQRTITRPSATTVSTTSTTSRPSTSHSRPTASISSQKLTNGCSEIVATPPPGVSIAETPNKDVNPITWLQESNNVVSEHHSDEPVTTSRAMEVNDNREFVALSYDKDTDNLLDSLFDDIINDDVADNLYGFIHQHHTTNTGHNC